MQGNNLPDGTLPELRFLMAVLAVAERCVGAVSVFEMANSEVPQ